MEYNRRGELLNQVLFIRKHFPRESRLIEFIYFKKAFFDKANNLRLGVLCVAMPAVIFGVKSERCELFHELKVERADCLINYYLIIL